MLNILFYSNCQFAGLQYFLEYYYLNKKCENVSFSHIENYSLIRDKGILDIGLLGKSDIFIYQPIALKHGIYSTSYENDEGIISHLNDKCLRIAFPYIYNDSIWPLIPPAIIDNLVGGYGKHNRYLNHEVIDNYVDSGIKLKEALKDFKKDKIDFDYQKRFEKSISILSEKEKFCDVFISEFIKNNIHKKKLFFTQNHPSTPVFVHCVNQILKIIGEKFKFNADDFPEDVCGFSPGFPHSNSDIKHWNFGYKIKQKSNSFYKKHIIKIYQNRLSTYAYPLAYSIPDECFIDSCVRKTKLFADIIPGKKDTYIYNNQNDYYNDYRESLFAYTYCKGGWDCLRHYEIIANRCIPYFLDLDSCPPSSLSTFPKDLVLKSMQELDEGTLTFEKYRHYLMQIFSHARLNMTCTSAAKYFINKMAQRNNHSNYLSSKPKVLMLNVGSVNYSRETLSIGLIQLLGSNYTDFPRNSNLYDGKEFTYTGVVSDEEIDRSHVKKYIQAKKYDYIVIANIDHGTKLKLSKVPFWRVILRNYDMRRIAFIFGGDQSPFINSSFFPTGETLQYFLQYGVCFVRESYDSFPGLAIADWASFADIRKCQWEKKIKIISSKSKVKVEWLPNYC